MIQGGGSLGTGEVMAVSLALAAVLVPLARRAALRLGVVDRPVPGQKSHASPIPYLGGAAVALTTLVAVAMVGNHQAVGLVLPAAAVAAIGLWDDIRTSSPQLRLVVEGLTGLATWRFTPLHGLYPGARGLVLTTAFMVLAANCFNLVDNTDGCAGAVGAALAGGVVVAGLMLGQAVTPLVAGAVVGSLLGFLVWNWHPARIFMGDAGSLFLGFLGAELVLRLHLRDRIGGHAVVALLFLAPVLFDTTLVVVSRVRAGRSIMIGGCDHTAHRLKLLGLTVPTVATILGLAGATCAGLAVAVSRDILAPGPALAIVSLAGAGFLVEFLRIPVYDTALASSGGASGDAAATGAAEVRTAVYEATG